MKKIINLSLAIVSLFVITSCSDDDTTVDTTKPSIQIISPTDHQEIAPGSVLNFKANLTDNVGLSSYKIEIHSAEDGHEHKAKQLAAAEFHYDFSSEIPNQATAFDLEKAIDIPED